DQGTLSAAQLGAFAQCFGPLDKAPFVYPFTLPTVDGHPEIFNNIKEASDGGINIGGFWHADVTYREKPHMASIFYALDVPDFGGDTMFANQYLAYETLPTELQKKLEGMSAVHSSEMPHGKASARFGSVARDRAPNSKDREYLQSKREVADVEAEEHIHPVVRKHPITGRKLLYVNRGFTSHFVGMSVEESLPLLEELWTHSGRAEFTCRYRWKPHTVCVADNCATQHYAINDYYGQRRHMWRVSVHES
ncbi:MAG: TauD/TfdA family dioxygenase, partial [Pseudomonadota bacterium]